MTIVRSLLPTIILVFSLAGSALHCKVEKGPTDQFSFFQKIDLDYPGLEQVKKAVELKDLDAAISAYADFKRGYNYPFPVSSELPVNYQSDKRLEEDSRAELAMKNIFRSQDVEYQFTGEINWHFNPTDKDQNKNYEGEYKREWVVMLHRMGWLRHLAGAFQETGNPVYVRKIDHLVNDWIENNPVGVPDKQSRWTTGWRTLEAGKRAGDSWALCWVKTVRCPELQSSTIFNWANSWMDHGEYLEQHSGTLNWLTDESKGLFTVGVLFPEFKQSEHWKELGVSRLLGQLETDFYPDGSQKELSPHYQVLATESLVEVLALSQLSKTGISPEFISKIEHQFDYLMKISMPDRQLPRLNDASSEDLVEILKKSAVATYPQKSEFQWFVSEGKKGSPPPFASVVLPWAGQAVMRNHWGKNANYLLFEYGPFGSGTHQHEDKLGIHIASYGETFVFEAGRENYGRSELRDYSVGSFAHSVVTIDGLGQNREEDSPELDIALHPDSAGWIANPMFDYATSTYGKNHLERYGDKNVNLGVWQRHVLFLKPDVFVIIDLLLPHDKEVHTYHSHFHLNADNANLDPSTKKVTITEKGRPTFCIAPVASDDLTARLFKGQTDPFYMGWELFTSKKDRPIPTLRYEKSGIGQKVFAYAFAGAPAGEAVPNLEMKQIGELPDGLYGIVIGGSVGKIGPVKIILSTGTDGKLTYEGAEYGTSALVVFENGKRMFDLRSGKEIKQG